MTVGLQCLDLLCVLSFVFESLEVLFHLIELHSTLDHLLDSVFDLQVLL